MNHLGPILATTDFSASARRAAHRAARLSHESGGPLSMMHVLPGAGMHDLRKWLGAGSATERHLQDEVRGQLKQLADELSAKWQVTARTVEASGNVLDEVVREADALDAAVLVLGARGAGTFRRMVLGTTSERLLRRTTRPLLVVRNVPHEPYRRVLLAVDFSAWSLHAVKMALQVARHAHFLLLNAFQVPFEEKLHFAGVDAATIDFYRRNARAEAIQRVHELAHAAGIQPGQWTPCISEGDASFQVLEQEREQNCDLVVLGKHGQSATEDLLLGSVTKHVLAEGKADVLVSTGREQLQ